MLVLVSDAYILLKAKHIIFLVKIFLNPAARSQSDCAARRKPEHLLLQLSRFLFQRKYIFRDWSKQFFQSTHANNIHKTIYAPAALTAFSGGCKIEGVGKIWFMYELLCLLSKRRLFLCRWIVLLKSAPWWPASLVSSLGILQDSRQTTSTPEQSNLLLCNCMEYTSIV